MHWAAPCVVVLLSYGRISRMLVFGLPDLIIDIFRSTLILFSCSPTRPSP